MVEQHITIEEGEQVISKENAEKVLSMMQSVVDEGTGKNARVEGYNVGGKTGTSEDGVNTGKRIASFVGVADITNPEVVIVVILYNPTGEGGHQGGAWVILTTHNDEKNIFLIVQKIHKRINSIIIKKK